MVIFESVIFHAEAIFISLDSYNPTVIDHCYSLTPFMGDMDKNGNYCDNKVSNHKWIWNTTTYEKPKTTWPIKDSTGKQSKIKNGL
jgi:hypothetical protein